MVDRQSNRLRMRLASHAGVLLALFSVGALLAGFGTTSDSADAASVSAPPQGLEVDAAWAPGVTAASTVSAASLAADASGASDRPPDLSSSPSDELSSDLAEKEPALSEAPGSFAPGRAGNADVLASLSDPAAPGGVIEELTPGTSVASLPVHRASTDGGQTVVMRGEIDDGESLAGELRGQGVSPSAIHEITRALQGQFDFRLARPGHRYRLVQDREGRPLEFRYAISSQESYRVVRRGDDLEVGFEQAELTARPARIAGLIETNLYSAIRALGENPRLASDFSHIFAWEVDFSREVRPGDSFQILYERLYRTDDDGYDVYVRPGRILAARYAGESGEHEAVLFQDDDGDEGYYRTDGSSVEREFLVAPLAYSRISSRYSPARRHPILKVTRPHHGIDYAAAEGAPIWAVADGVVIYRGWGGGFGNLVKVRHTNGYISYYAHMSRFAKGLEVGQSVSQKEVIGFVGHTGLATGPHVCFRVQRDGRYVNPLEIRSEAGKSIPPETWARFRSARDELLASLTGDSGTVLAAADDSL